MSGLDRKHSGNIGDLVELKIHSQHQWYIYSHTLTEYNIVGEEMAFFYVSSSFFFALE